MHVECKHNSGYISRWCDLLTGMVSKLKQTQMKNLGKIHKR